MFKDVGSRDAFLALISGPVTPWVMDPCHLFVIFYGSVFLPYVGVNYTYLTR